MKKQQKPDPRAVSRELYADIINLPHHEPDPIKHPRMPLYKRAAQFAPFAALRGYDDMVNEEIRVPKVDHKRELEEHEAEILNQKLNRIMQLTAAGEHPTVTFTVYEADKRKSGGRYVKITDSVKRVDIVNRVIELTSMDGFLNRVVEFDDIADIQ